MRRAIALFVVLAAVGLFALLNWNVFVTPTELSLGVTTVMAPLGLVMLGVLVFVTLLFVVYAVSMQAGALVESRRLAKDLHTQRELADKAEASRFTELRTFLVAEMQNLATAQEQNRTALLARIDRAQESARLAHEEAVNTVAAQLGELEDRLERAQAIPGSYERTDTLVRR